MTCLPVVAVVTGEHIEQREVNVEGLLDRS